MIFTYSPNWYRPQCVHFTSDSMLYSSNYSLYECGVEGGGVRREVCFRELAMVYGLNHKDIKVNAIASVREWVVVGVNQPCLFTLSRDSLEPLQATLLQGFTSVEYLHTYEQDGEEVALVCNKDGAMAKCYLRQPKLPLQLITHKIKPSPVKGIFRLNHQRRAVVFTRGTLLIYDANFNQLLKNVQISSHDTVYSVDCFNTGEQTYCCFLTRNKDSHTVTTFRLSLEHEFPLEFKKKVEQVGVGIKRFNLNWYYPKNMSEKVKGAAKASLSVKMLDQERVLVTGKFGEVAQMRVSKVGENANLAIKPFSHQDENGPYCLWPDSRHYKQIYHIETHQQRLYLLSTDHNLSVWANAHQQPKYLFSYKFLTAAVGGFLPVPQDPHTLIALLKDSVIRSWEWEEGGRQLNEFWKFSKKYRVTKAVCHPTEQGVVGLVTACHRIQIYDIHQDRLIKLLEMGEQILNISFEHASVKSELQALFEGQFAPTKYNCGHLFDRKLEVNTVLLVQLGKKIVVAHGLGEQQVEFWVRPRERRLQRIHDTRYWDGKLLLASQSYKNVLSVYVRTEGKNIPHLSLPLTLQQGRTMFKVEKGSKSVRIINFKGSKLVLHLFEPHQEGWNPLGDWEVNLQHPIDFLHLPHSQAQALIYSQRDDCMTILHFGELKESPVNIQQGSPLATMLLVPHKLDSFMIWGEQLLAMATKHQTIQVMPLKQLEQWHKVQVHKKAPVTPGVNSFEQRKEKREGGKVESERPVETKQQAGQQIVDIKGEIKQQISSPNKKESQKQKVEEVPVEKKQEQAEDMPKGEESSHTAINETYKIWKKHVPFLYNILHTYSLSTASQTVDWLPAQHIHNDWNIMHLLLGTNSLTRNSVMVTTLGLPTRDAVTDHSGYRDDPPEAALASNGYTGTMGLQSTTVKHSIPQASEIMTARAHPSQEHVIAVKTGGNSSEYLLYDMRQPEQQLQKSALKLQGHTDEGLALHWHPSVKSHLLSGAFDKKILLHDIGKGVNPIREWSADEVVEDVRWSQKNPQLMGSVHQDKRVNLWDLREPEDKPFLSVEAHNGEVYSLDFNYKSQFLLLTSGQDSDVGLWDVRNMSRKMHTFVGHNEAVSVVRWDPHSSTHFASGSNDRRVVVWDWSKVTDSKQILFIHGGHRSRVTDLSWCPRQSSVIASTEEGCVVQVWQMTQSLLNQE